MDNKNEKKIPDPIVVKLDPKKEDNGCAIEALQKGMNKAVSRRARWMFAIITLIMIVFTGFGYYKLVYTKTPSYTLMVIGESIKNKDVQTFNEHVDVKGIVASYLDDQYQKDPSLAANPFAGLFWNTLKNVAEDTVQNHVNATISGEKTSEPSKGKDNPIVKAVDKKAGIKGHVTVEKVEKIGAHPDETIDVKVILKSDKEQEPITMILAMRALKDGSWQVYKINNLDDLLER